MGLYISGHLDWKAWDADPRTVSQQPDRDRMEIDRAIASRGPAFWASAALFKTRDSRRHFLRGAGRHCLAPAPARSSPLADRLLLLHDLAARGALAKDSRYVARSGQAPARKKKPRPLRSSTARALKYLTTEECAAT